MTAPERAKACVEKWVREGGPGSCLEVYLAEAIAQAMSDMRESCALLARINSGPTLAAQIRLIGNESR